MPILQYLKNIQNYFSKKQIFLELLETFSRLLWKQKLFFLLAMSSGRYRESFLSVFWFLSKCFLIYKLSFQWILVFMC